jgi:hypothetical protein
MTPPVENLGEQHSRHERGTDHDDRRRAFSAPPAPLRALAELRARRSGRGWGAGLLVGRCLPSRTCLDQAWLQLAQEGSVIGQLFGQPLADAVAARCGPAGKLLQALSASLDRVIGLRHFLTGGASPVAMRQIFEAARRAAIVAPAARPA